MRTGLYSHLSAFLAAALLLGCASKPSTPSPEVPDVPPPSTGGQEVRMHGATVHRVRLDRPHVLRRPDGGLQEFREAYLVRLEMTLPRPGGELLELYVGEERVHEYGGWKGGIYFKVYQETRIRRIDGGELSWRWQTPERTASGLRIELAGREDLPLESEAEVLRR